MKRPANSVSLVGLYSPILQRGPLGCLKWEMGKKCTVVALRVVSSNSEKGRLMLRRSPCCLCMIRVFPDAPFCSVASFTQCLSPSPLPLEFIFVFVLFYVNPRSCLSFGLSTFFIPMILFSCLFLIWWWWFLSDWGVLVWVVCVRYIIRRAFLDSRRNDVMARCSLPPFFFSFIGAKYNWIFILHAWSFDSLTVREFCRSMKSDYYRWPERKEQTNSSKLVAATLAAQLCV